MKQARHPYVIIRCSVTGERLRVKEGDEKWLWHGREFRDLDDILAVRRRWAASDSKE